MLRDEKAGESSTNRVHIGCVVSHKMNKTIVVKVSRRVKHPLGKYVNRFSKMYAHDELEQAKEGDRVLIKQSRPISKLKHWVLVKVLGATEGL